MREGEIVELADAEQIWTDPQHDYTRDLLRSFPRLTGDGGGGTMTTLDVAGVTKIYNVRGAGHIKALDDVSFTL
jgi:ABC-type oligopeptide transport system ATPase subunit